MRIMIVSDTHKQHRNLAEALEQVGKIDLLIHLGDAEGYEDYIREMADCPMHCVLGNNDFFSQLEREKEIQLGDYRVLLTHGHYYYVSTSMERIRIEAKNRGMDIVMFGHTHRPIVEEGKGVILVNPGSISYPRQIGRQPSYILMTIDSKGKVHFEICYL